MQSGIQNCEVTIVAGDLSLMAVQIFTDMKLSHFLFSLFYLLSLVLFSIKFISGTNAFTKKQQIHTQSENNISKEEQEPNDWL
ncbi:MAG: hypothetical protein ABJB16_08445, partial [Saprospiraceae bacterium]